MSTNTTSGPLSDRFTPKGPVAALLALGLLASACGSSATDNAVEAPEAPAAVEAASEGAMTDEAATDDGAAATAAISIKDFAFSGDMKAAPGTVITVTNDDSTAHTLTSSDDAFDTGNLAPGESVTITVPSDPGDYAFFCSIHPSMTGTLVVGA